MFIGYTHIKCIFIVLLFLCVNAQAQLLPISYSKNKADGLQSNTVYFIHVAKNGLLYIGHSKGLSSFDGNCFKNYINARLPFSSVSNILETANGKIFCKTFDNNLFYVENDSLQHIRYLPTQIGYTSSAVYENTIISYSNDSVFFFNAVTKKETAKDVNKAIQSTHCKEIIFASYVRFSGIDGLLLVDKQYHLYREKDTSIGGQLFFDQGELFLAKEKSIKQLFHYNTFRNIALANSLDNAMVNNVCTRNGVYWICTTNGLYTMHNEKISTDAIFKNFNITGIAITAENNFVLSTLNDGLSFFSNQQVNILPNLPDAISTICRKQHNILVGTKYGELFEYNIQTYTASLLKKLSEVKNIEFLMYDTINKLTIAATNKTYFIYNHKQYIDKLFTKSYTYVNGLLVLSTNIGVFIVDPGNKKTWLHRYIDTRYKSPFRPLKKLTLFDEPVRTIVYDSLHKTIYFNTYTGIWALQDSFVKPKLLPNPWCVLSDMCVFENKLLLATKDNGIIDWNKKDAVKGNSAYRLKNTPNGIYNAFQIYANELWMLAEDALYCYKLGKITKYDNSLGFSIDKIINFNIDEKSIYANIGTAIITIPKNINIHQTDTASLLINSIKTKKNNKVSNNIQLAHHNNSLIIGFSLIAFANASHTHAAYSINNEDTIHLPNTTREIYLNNITPDDYTLRIFCVVNDKIMCAQTKQIVFTIRPPYYKTWWFGSIILIICLLSTYFIFRFILAKWKKDALLREAKLILEKELDKSILTSIKAQMNPHFLFNALNTIQSYIYMNDKKNASIYISKFSDLTRSILDLSAKELITLDEEINSLLLYLDLEKMRFEDSFEYQCIVEKQIQKEKIKIPSMLIQPYVENAIKHGLLHKKNNRKLWIRFVQQDHLLQITIEDNGIGRKRSTELNAIKNRKHKSFAMDANKKRLEILQNRYKDIQFHITDKHTDLGEPSGTIVSIRLPI